MPSQLAAIANNGRTNHRPANMEDADRANDAMEADDAGVAAAVERGEQHRDDETDSSSTG